MKRIKLNIQTFTSLLIRLRALSAKAKLGYWRHLNVIWLKLKFVFFQHVKEAKGPNDYIAMHESFSSSRLHTKTAQTVLGTCGTSFLHVFMAVYVAEFFFLLFPSV